MWGTVFGEKLRGYFLLGRSYSGQAGRLPGAPVPSDATRELAGTSSARLGELRAAWPKRNRPLASFPAFAVLFNSLALS